MLFTLFRNFFRAFLLTPRPQPLHRPGFARAASRHHSGRVHPRTHFPLIRLPKFSFSFLLSSFPYFPRLFSLICAPPFVCIYSCVSCIGVFARLSLRFSFDLFRNFSVLFHKIRLHCLFASWYPFIKGNVTFANSSGGMQRIPVPVRFLIAVLLLQIRSFWRKS